ncbi:tetratricopeptide repeat protein [Hyphomicrobium sulfonivorans]|uniref:tetratricopeptide repeat protein n=1 Tax=Hyphomicrobium sulfonivorans TaxID=121290 RepID=UPI00156EEB83|nr:hypothetical protein [Hyphomicrobium sulfonivorans]MBI1649451.1 hypothetical protein [Hyphomicrobium sulfonivorans]NSL71368.1 hypothetical protein [Hyphomicrobium sulfonivorans]
MLLGEVRARIAFALKQAGKAVLALLLVTSVAYALEEAKECEGEGIEAIVACTRILTKDPTNAAALSQRGMLYATARQYEKALSDLNAALLQDTDQEANLTARSHVNFRLGRFDAAIADANQLLNDRRNLRGLYHRANAHLGSGQFANAVVDYTAYINRDDDFIFAYTGRARALSELNLDNSALRDADMAFNLLTKSTEPRSPDQADVYETRGAIYEKLQLIFRARSDYARCVEYDPERQACAASLQRLQAQDLTGSDLKLLATAMAAPLDESPAEKNPGSETPPNETSAETSSVPATSGIFAAYTPTEHHTSRVVWGPSVQVASELSMQQCRSTSDACGNKPAVTGNLDDVFAVMCCSKPRVGCAAFASANAADAKRGVEELFKEAGFSKCKLANTLSARTGQKP